MSYPTLAAIRIEAARVYGAELLDVSESGSYHTAGRAVVLFVSGRRRVCFEGRSKAAARKLALETLRAMGEVEP